MKNPRKFLSVICFIGLLSFIFSILILTPKITFAEGAEEVASEALAEAKININNATQEELAQLKGVGEKLAARIIEYRDQHGPFEKIEDILKVKGLGEKFLEENHDRITVGEEAMEEALPDIHTEE
ncbi:MAG: ComEA family DNA-binding protein [bacterium]